MCRVEFDEGSQATVSADLLRLDDVLHCA
jgi:hypothetical protein